VARVGHMVSPLRQLANYTHLVEFMFDLFGQYDFLPSDALLRWFGRDVCNTKAGA
jgi:hypothetical protein